MLRILTPDATDEEIAALLTVFSAMGGSAEAAVPQQSNWVAHQRRARPTLPHGPSAWRASALPH